MSTRCTDVQQYSNHQPAGQGLCRYIHAQPLGITSRERADLREHDGSVQSSGLCHLIPGAGVVEHQPYCLGSILCGEDLDKCSDSFTLACDRCTAPSSSMHSRTHKASQEEPEPWKRSASCACQHGGRKLVLRTAGMPAYTAADWQLDRGISGGSVQPVSYCQQSKASKKPKAAGARAAAMTGSSRPTASPPDLDVLKQHTLPSSFWARSRKASRCS